MWEALIAIVYKQKIKINKQHSHNNPQGHELWQFDLLSTVNNIYTVYIPLQDSTLLFLFLIFCCSLRGVYIC